MAPIVTPLQLFSAPSTCQLPPGERGSEFSVLGQISKYLKIVPIEGKGLGGVATQDVEPFTLLLSEVPTAIYNQYDDDREKETVSVLEAYHRMNPTLLARFDALYEASIELEPREMRVWMTNALYWPSENERKENEQRRMSLCIDMARVNHSCLPNALGRADVSQERMNLTSSRAIRAGEEITISYYDDGLYYRTAAERNAVLKYTHDFACKCRACTDLAPISYRRRQKLKHVFYCKLWDWPISPDYPAVSSYEDVITNELKYGLLQSKKHIMRPNPDLAALRQTAKLEWDESLINVHLIKGIFMESSTSLVALQLQRLTARMNEADEVPLGKSFQRTLLLMSTCKSLLRMLYPADDNDQRQRTHEKAMLFQALR